MKNKIIPSLAVMAVLIAPIAVFASTYQYVDNGGRLQSVEANSPTEAFARASNIDPNSGVMLASKNVVIVPAIVYVAPTNTTGTYHYQYVNTSGNLQSVWANSPSAALALATNIAYNSGVMLVK